MKKRVMIIVPTLNGYAFMPFDLNTVISHKDAADPNSGILVSRDLNGLVDDVRAVYSDEADGEPAAE